ncbi:MULTISPECIES: hypothetical protein [Thalassotalea]|uniref:hypothetical protein n=1 Tax=Thalassotalea TaxID=1518149 RepID=UPI000943F799|nr:MULTISPECIES: hypothetical protein [Thalassotalea]OKY24992.1 hypothetical protein BI291_17505 [Thalassotalea sp. PP2-459]
MHYFKLIILLAVISGCASTKPEENTEQAVIEYNNNNEIASIVAKPRRNLCLLTDNCSWLGATWTAESPNEVTLLVHFRAGFNLKQTTLYIDKVPVVLVKGKEVTQFDSHSGAFPGMRGDVESSTLAYRMPIEMFERILAAKTVEISIEPYSRHKRHFFDKVATENKHGYGFKAIESLMKALNKA